MPLAQLVLNGARHDWDDRNYHVILWEGREVVFSVNRLVRIYQIRTMYLLCTQY